MPALIMARKYHSSIAIDKHLYAMGGCIAVGVYSSLIEMLDLESKQAWQRLLNHDSVGREHAAVTGISLDKIAVFGGFLKNDGFKNDGYMISLSTKQVTPILGRAKDFKIGCNSQT